MLGEFEIHRGRGDLVEMERVLRAANFRPVEIEEIIWAKGDLGRRSAPEGRVLAVLRGIVGRLILAGVFGLLAGGTTVMVEYDLSWRFNQKTVDALAGGFISPTHPFLNTFLLGLAGGGLVGLIFGFLFGKPFLLGKGG